ncbi:ADP-ribose glycohydrolase OARD1 isoform X2 [Syngnathus acus]|uniref:ADP-ribose glycohydrolase OARD1 isoform X2 n=1 Tax=Syngnathus acus TaxID=161584 RepID=UPI0018861166|nr:ADP-ribose glycohydrolase OARD1 isoform X2 [Syngnathus acus]
MASQPGMPDTLELANDKWRLNHVTGDLFSCPVDEAVAHCISEDCRMGAGIAVIFKRKFGGVEELKAQKKLMGQCAVLKRGKRFVYYLITKKKASQKPTYDNLRQSLEDMRAHLLAVAWIDSIGKEFQRCWKRSLNLHIFLLQSTASL